VSRLKKTMLLILMCIICIIILLYINKALGRKYDASIEDISRYTSIEVKVVKNRGYSK